jgi:hypothetical protein
LEDIEMKVLSPFGAADSGTSGEENTTMAWHASTAVLCAPLLFLLVADSIPAHAQDCPSDAEDDYQPLSGKGLSCRPSHNRAGTRVLRLLSRERSSAKSGAGKHFARQKSDCELSSPKALPGTIEREALVLLSFLRSSNSEPRMFLVGQTATSYDVCITAALTPKADIRLRRSK